jgi:uncharacterized protein YjbI with pentapeptide repeats
MEDLKARWQTTEGRSLAREVLLRLTGNRSMDDLQLGEHDGRVDLRGLVVDSSLNVGAMASNRRVNYETVDPLVFRRSRLVDLDLSSAVLPSARFFSSTLINCRLDRALCRDWRMWATDVSESTFVGADLRQAVLGAWYENRGNVFRGVDFSAANMRSIVCSAATFIDCNFGDARIAKVDFQSSSFQRCRFTGVLREVIFYDHGFRTGKLDPNSMEDVDFAAAELRMVEFRRLNLDRVMFPSSPDHIVVRHYRCVLRHAIGELEGVERWKGLFTLFEHRLKWSGPRQDVGVFNRLDLREMRGEAEAAYCERLLRRLETDCGGGAA